MTVYPKLEELTKEETSRVLELILEKLNVKVKQVHFQDGYDEISLEDEF
jgi:hypothetical protein